MSAIRPHLPLPSGPLSAPTPAPARAAQAAFFQAALQGVATTPTPQRAQEAQAAVARAAQPSSERHMRPGALLDIRV